MISPEAIRCLISSTASRSACGTSALTLPRPTPFSFRPNVAFRPPCHVPSWIDLIVRKTAASTPFFALVRMCLPSDDWSASTPIPQRARSPAAFSAPSPQPPATWKTTPEPRAIWFSASSLHLAWSSQSCE